MSLIKDKAVKSFPIRLGGIDVGSNALRFTAAEFTSPHHFKPLASERISLRLGHAVFLGGGFEQRTINQAVKVIDLFRKKTENLHLQQVRAIATSAVRESSNGSLLVEQIMNKTGIKLEVISGSEEARLAYLAVKNVFPLGRKKWILIDLGGGSVEVSEVTKEKVLWTETLALGAVRLLESLAVFNKHPQEFASVLNDYLAAFHIPSASKLKRTKNKNIIATGGNIERLAKLAKVESTSNGYVCLSLQKLRRVIDCLVNLDTKERAKKLGLMKDRADVVLPAAKVYEYLCQLTGAKNILIPYIGVKEGILFDLAEEVASDSVNRESKEKQVLTSCVNLGRRYKFDEQHGLHVAQLALELFDQLQSVHHLNGDSRRLLMAGAVLHDIGTYISYKGHHKHSFYLITQAELPTFSAKEILMLANLARYHRKSGPKPDHNYYYCLSKDEQEKVVKLAAILRLADALDREHLQRIRSVIAQMAGGALKLKLKADGDISLEEWALKKKSGIFQETYGLKVKLAD